MTVQSKALWRNGLAATLQTALSAKPNVYQISADDIGDATINSHNIVINNSYAEHVKAIEKLVKNAEVLNATITTSQESPSLNIYLTTSEASVDIEAITKAVTKALDRQKQRYGYGVDYA